MKRGNFLKSLATLIAAPSLIEKIELKDDLPAIKPNSYMANFAIMIPHGTTKLNSHLNLSVPDYYNQVVRKCGHTSYEWVMNEGK